MYNSDLNGRIKLEISATGGKIKSCNIVYAIIYKPAIYWHCDRIWVTRKSINDTSIETSVCHVDGILNMQQKFTFTRNPWQDNCEASLAIDNVILDISSFTFIRFIHRPKRYHSMLLIFQFLLQDNHQIRFINVIPEMERVIIHRLSVTGFIAKTFNFPS